MRLSPNLRVSHGSVSVSKVTDRGSETLFFECFCLSATLALANPALPGGNTTHQRKKDHNAFSHPAANLSFADQMTFKLGNAIFRKVWIASPASTRSSDGLGPLYNARSCQRCHIKDGRGAPLGLNNAQGVSGSVLTLRSLLTSGAGDPVYGHQLQDFAIAGHLAEAKIQVNQEQQHRFGVSLVKPVITLTDWSSGPLSENTEVHMRIAPPMIGLGLIEAISDSDIAQGADPNDTDNNGISGRAHWLDDGSLGRFGWKAATASIDEQAAQAFVNDMGLSSMHKRKPAGDCTARQTRCLHAPNGENDGQPEVSEQMMHWISFYARHLAVPARPQHNHTQVRAGQRLFHKIGCAACHTPSFKTGLSQFKALSEQTIYPYSDFLLHDMGAGLAVQSSEHHAQGAEWRTPPLWGIGHTQTVSGHSRFLHDGRARNLREAIAWHGGEAENAAQHFFALSLEDRNLLLVFLNSL